MKLKVMYCSSSGNTKKVGDAIASAVGQIAEHIPPAYPLENVDLLFLGGGVYAGKIKKEMEEFIETLDPSRAKKVALYSTSGGQDTAIVKMRELLAKRGIEVMDESFLCRGKFFVFFNRKRPNDEDIKKAQEFANKMVSSLS